MSAKSANHDHMIFLDILWQGIGYELGGGRGWGGGGMHKQHLE